LSACATSPSTPKAADSADARVAAADLVGRYDQSDIIYECGTRVVRNRATRGIAARTAVARSSAISAAARAPFISGACQCVAAGSAQGIAAGSAFAADTSARDILAEGGCGFLEHNGAAVEQSTAGGRPACASVTAKTSNAGSAGREMAGMLHARCAAGGVSSGATFATPSTLR
jgi:hypothetical protein